MYTREFWIDVSVSLLLLTTTLAVLAWGILHTPFFSNSLFSFLPGLLVSYYWLQLVGHTYNAILIVLFDTSDVAVVEEYLLEEFDKSKIFGNRPPPHS